MKKLLTFVVLALLLCVGTAQAESLNFLSKDFDVTGKKDFAVSLLFAGQKLDISFAAEGKYNVWNGWDNGMGIGLQSSIGSAGYSTISFSQALDLSSLRYEAGMYNALRFGYEDGSFSDWLAMPNAAYDETINLSAYKNVVSITLQKVAGYNGIPGTFYFKGLDFDFSPTATPVPAAVWLLGSGLAGVVALRRKIS